MRTAPVSPDRPSPRRVAPWCLGAAALLAGACGTVPSPREAGPVRLAPGLEVDVAASEVRVAAEVATDRGWLEQAVCRRGTRDHESLLTVRVAPSAIHAALLLVGAVPGRPGRWRQGADGGVLREAPSGDGLEVRVRDPAGDRAIEEWIHDPVHGRAFPAAPWVFAGSEAGDRDPARPATASYPADRSGSVVGIVTFGDEVVACRDVLADRADVDAPAWQARTGAMPAPGTAVTLVIRPLRRPQEVAP
jgi:hypothetical protein